MANRGSLPPWAALGWHLLALGLIATAPGLIWLRKMPWALTPGQQTSLWFAVLGYLVLAMYAMLLHREAIATASRQLLIVAVLLVFGLTFALSRLEEPGISRGVWFLSLVFAGCLSWATTLTNRRQHIVLCLTALLVLTVAATFEGGRRLAIGAASARSRVASTILLPIEIRIHPTLTGPKLDDGGAIVRLRDDLLVMTGRGRLYRMSWDSAGASFRSEQLPIAPPMDRAAYLADQSDSLQVRRLRINGMTVDTSVVPARLYVSHHAWHHDGRCFTLRLSSAVLPEATTSAGAAAWTTEFDSSPCLPPTGAYDGIESGGRLAWTADGALLLTVGDFGYNGIQMADYAQDSTTSYGKVFRRDPGTREWSRFTIGHRNPQGLLVDRSGRIWETEHGPRGGDEVNLLSRGSNYGWPRATYGVQYGSHYWPLNPDGMDHRGFVEPIFAFLPSIGISNLIEIVGDAFPPWKGDLLLSSLGNQSLWRARVREGRVVTVEQIPIGRRIRDLVLDARGLIVLWTDEGDLVTIGRAAGGSTPESAFEQCRGCHEPSSIGTMTGPSLRGVVGRRIAGLPGYRYSGSLASLGGDWTETRLDRFLADPTLFAPGTAMSFGGVPDAAERRKVIEYLQGYR